MVDNIHADLIRLYAEYAIRYVKPWTFFEVNINTHRWVTLDEPPRWSEHLAYRLKRNDFGVPHVHHKLIDAYALDAKTCPTPWQFWEYKASSLVDWAQCEGCVLFLPFQEYRRKI